jgi:hypothetical protein
LGSRSRNRPRPPRPFSDQHSTMTNIDYRPDQQGGMGNGMFQDAVYRTETPQQCAPVGGGGFLGGILGALMGGMGAESEGGRCAEPALPSLGVEQPKVVMA